MSDGIYIEFTDGSFLASLDPMPLFPEEEALYDGQLRTPDGRFDFGRRIDVARTSGIRGKITVAEATTMLAKPVTVSDLHGNKIVFTPRLLDKYGRGCGRQKGADKERLRQLGKAIYAVSHAKIQEIVELPGHNPPQVQYLYKIKDREAIIVYVDKETHQARGFTYTSHKNADTFLAQRKGR